jgi:hypothetical protein
MASLGYRRWAIGGSPGQVFRIRYWMDLLDSDVFCVLRHRTYETGTEHYIIAGRLLSETGAGRLSLLT